MDEKTIEKVTAFVRPLYQDLDGASRLDQIDRIAAIARLFHRPETEDGETHFELLLRFQGLQKWLEKIGNFSRTTLALRGVVKEEAIGEVLRSLRRAETPESPAERALAAARLIEESGAHGLALRLSSARREGSSIAELARDVLANETTPPEWMSHEARSLLATRRARAKQFCEEVLSELDNEDCRSPE